MLQGDVVSRFHDCEKYGSELGLEVDTDGTGDFCVTCEGRVLRTACEVTELGAFLHGYRIGKSHGENGVKA